MYAQDTALSGSRIGTLAASESPYYLNNLVVPENQTLVIEPGVQVFLDEASKITVYGTLRCGSPEGPPVLFEGQNDASVLQFDFSLRDAHGRFQNTIIRNIRNPNAPFFLLQAGTRLNLNGLHVENVEAPYLVQSEAGAQIKLTESRVEKSTFYESVIVSEKGNLSVDHTLFFDLRLDGTLVEASDIRFVNNTVYQTRHTEGDGSGGFLFGEARKIFARNNIMWPSSAYRGGIPYDETAHTYHLKIESNVIKGGWSTFLGGAKRYTIDKKVSISETYEQEPVFVGGDPFDARLAAGSVGKDQGWESQRMRDADGSRTDLGSLGGTRRIPFRKVSLSTALLSSSAAYLEQGGTTRDVQLNLDYQLYKFAIFRSSAAYSQTSLSTPGSPVSRGSYNMTSLEVALMAQLWLNWVHFYAGPGIRYSRGEWVLTDDTHAAYERISYAISEEFVSQEFQTFYVIGIGVRVIGGLHFNVEYHDLWHTNNKVDLVVNRSLISLRDLVPPVSYDVEALIRLPTLRFGLGYVF